METVQILKPYNNMDMTRKLPSKMTIETDTCRKEIFFPEHGSNEDVLTYLRIFNELRFTIPDESIIP